MDVHARVQNSAVAHVVTWVTWMKFSEHLDYKKVHHLIFYRQLQCD